MQRVMKLLTRKGYLIEAQGMVYLDETDSSTAMTPLQSAASLCQRTGIQPPCGGALRHESAQKTRRLPPTGGSGQSG